MNAKIHTVGRNFGAIAVLGLVVVGCSYMTERPKYAFEAEAREFAKTAPGVRILGTVKTGDFASPLSWFRATHTAFRFARPDPLQQGRFELIGVVHDPRQMFQQIADVDCSDRSIMFSSTDEDEASPALRDFFGREVTDNEGKVYRIMEHQPEPLDEQLKAFCDTDWTPELNEIRQAMAAERAGRG